MVTVLERPRPAWAPIGVRTPGFLIYPEVSGGVAYDDNIFATDTGAVADAVFTVQPRLTIQSDWGRHAFSFVAGSTISRYAGRSDQDTEQYSFLASGDLDLHHDLKIEAQASYARMVLPRTSDSYAEASTTPLLYDQALADVEATKRFGRFRIDGKLQLERTLYDDGLSPAGTRLDFQFRNRDAVGVDLRVDYDYSAKTAFFLREIVTFSRRDRVLYRDETVNETLVGADLQPTHHIVAELAVGVLTTSFSAPSDEDTAVPDGRARIVYSPTRKVTVTAAAERGVIDSGVPTSPAYDNTTLSLSSDYEFRRNVILSGKLSKVFNDYHGLDRHDEDNAIDVTARYLANHALSFNLAYSLIDRTSHGAEAGRRFDDNILSLNVTLRR